MPKDTSNYLFVEKVLYLSYDKTLQQISIAQEPHSKQQKLVSKVVTKGISVG